MFALATKTNPLETDQNESGWFRAEQQNAIKPKASIPQKGHSSFEMGFYHIFKSFSIRCHVHFVSIKMDRARDGNR